MRLFARPGAGGVEPADQPRGRLLPGEDAALALVRGFLDAGPTGRIAALLPGGGLRLLDPVEAAMLQAMEKPCDEGVLARRLRAAGWETDGLEAAGEALLGLERRGLAMRLGSLIDEARRATGESGDEGGARAGPGLECLAIPTRDRPASLRRALGAWGEILRAEAAAGGARERFVIVADDSRRDGAATRAVVEEFAAGRTGPTCLLDAGARRELAERLSSVCGPAARFALGLDREDQRLRAYGAARNFLLLAAAGRTVAMADDDTVPEFRRHPAARGGLALCAEPDPTMARPFSDRGELESWVAPAGPALAPHDRLLGLSTRRALLGAEELDLGAADHAAIEAALDAGTRIGALCFGTWGTSGMPSNRYLLALRDRVESAGEYDDRVHGAAIGTNLLFRAPRRATIGGRIFAGGHIALDARTLLPPFSPYGADEDGLWGHCLAFLHPELRIAYPAEAIFHDPPDPRPRGGEDPRRWDFRLNEILRSLVASFSSSREGGSEAYMLVGGRLASLAHGPRSAFRETLAEVAAQTVAARIGVLERALASHGGEPTSWAADVTAVIDFLAGFFEEEGFWLPREFAGSDLAESLLVEYVADFGELFAAWPALVGAAGAVAPELLDAARLGGAS